LYQKPLTPPGLSDEEKDMDPIDAFVLLEHYNIFVLIQKIHKALGSLSRVLRGVIAPSEDCFNTANALMTREVFNYYHLIRQQMSKKKNILLGSIVLEKVMGRSGRFYFVHQRAC
jgi:hypothetical protein